jgi:hypothetical protein
VRALSPRRSLKGIGYLPEFLRAGILMLHRMASESFTGNCRPHLITVAFFRVR